MRTIELVGGPKDGARFERDDAPAMLELPAAAPDRRTPLGRQRFDGVVRYERRDRYSDGPRDGVVTYDYLPAAPA